MRFMKSYGLSAYDADVLVAEKERADYYEDMLKSGAEPKLAANWLINEYLARLKKAAPVATADRPVFYGSTPQGPSPTTTSTIVQMITSGEISGKIAKQLYDIVWERGPDADARAIVEELGLRQVTNTGAIEAAVEAVIAANPDKVAAVQAKPAMLGWFVGQVMKSTGGKANPQAVNELLKKKLGI
jgi:aspartyl-tRNA(Asn)/glutamyl-tRNA(Gln) amidotransferase subunit B